MIFQRSVLALFFICIVQSCMAQFAVELETTNTLVQGMDNPIFISHVSVPDSNIALFPSVGKILKRAPNRYTWRSIGIHGKDIAILTIVDTVHHDTLGQRTYYVRELLCEPLLGAKHRSKKMKNGAFKAQAGIGMVVYDYCGRMNMIGFDVIRINKDGESEQCHNRGARFGEEAKTLVNKARPGDQYVFKKIYYQGPGMKEARRYPRSLYFTIE